MTVDDGRPGRYVAAKPNTLFAPARHGEQQIPEHLRTWAGSDSDADSDSGSGLRPLDVRSFAAIASNRGVASSHRRDVRCVGGVEACVRGERREGRLLDAAFSSG